MYGSCCGCCFFDFVFLAADLSDSVDSLVVSSEDSFESSSSSLSDSSSDLDLFLCFLVFDFLESFFVDDFSPSLLFV